MTATAAAFIACEDGNSGCSVSSVPLWRFMANAWLRHQNRQTVHSIMRLDHDGVREDFRRASGA